MNDKEFMRNMLERNRIMKRNEDLIEALEMAEDIDSNIEASLVRRIVSDYQRLIQLTDEAVDYTKQEITRLEEMARENSYTNPELDEFIIRYRISLGRMTEYDELIDEQVQSLKKEYNI